MMRLTQSKAKAYRESMLAQQGHRCALTGYSLSAAEAVLDHDHKTGHCRAVLHRGINSLLGKIENNHRRYGVSIPMLRAMAPAIANYLSQDYSGNPIYYSHRTDDEKRELRNTKARKARAAKKAS